jgi:holo-[acyl-carrier protein] synthase
MLKQLNGLVPDQEQKKAWTFIASYLAGRWAAKEAVVKACHWRKLTLGQVQIMQDRESGRIYGIILDGEAKGYKVNTGSGKGAGKEVEGSEEEGNPREGLVEMEQEPGQVVRVSISHDGDYATAVCIAASDEGREGDVGGEAAAREPI